MAKASQYLGRTRATNGCFSNTRLRQNRGFASLVRRCRPPRASEKQAVLGELWLFGQCSIFVRNCEQLARPPLGFKVDQKFVDGLADTIARWAVGGLLTEAR